MVFWLAAAALAILVAAGLVVPALRVRAQEASRAEYDMNVLGIEDRLGKYRSGFRLTYFQYLAALYSEIHLDEGGRVREQLCRRPGVCGEALPFGLGPSCSCKLASIFKCNCVFIQ